MQLFPRLLAASLLLAPAAPAAPAAPSDPGVPGIHRAAAVARAAAPAETRDGLAFSELARAWAERHGVADVTASEEPFADFQGVLERAFCRAPMGVFDVRHARAYLGEKDGAEELRGVCLALLDLQIAWNGRFGSATSEGKSVGADLAKLRKWLARARVTKKAMDAPASDLIEYFGGGEKERELAEAVSTGMITGGGLGFVPKRDRPVTIVFAPERLEFISLCAYVGWMNADWRGTYWVEDVPNWTEFYWLDLQVVALSYPPTVPTDDLTASTPMDEREATGLVQHIVQRGTHSLCWLAFGRSLDAAFESGLAQELVVEVCGENNARSGGNGRGSHKDGWSMFVPGGASQGGLLPGMNADSLWREDRGADRFLKVLRLAQREGGKEARNARDKLPYFEITHDDGVQKRTIRAPFFGAAAAAKELPPADFLADYREFFRAYKTCFAYWLAEHAEGPSRKSRAKLAELLANVAAAVPDDMEAIEEAAPGAGFQEVLEATYGRAWSAESAEPANLEWEFLAWLAKQ